MALQIPASSRHGYSCLLLRSIGKFSNVSGHAWIADVAVREVGVPCTPAGRRVAAGAEARQPAQGLAALDADFGKTIAHGWWLFLLRVLFGLEKYWNCSDGIKTAMALPLLEVLTSSRAGVLSCFVSDVEEYLIKCMCSIIRVLEISACVPQDTLADQYISPLDGSDYWANMAVFVSTSPTKRSQNQQPSSLDLRR